MTRVWRSIPLVLVSGVLAMGGAVGVAQARPGTAPMPNSNPSNPNNGSPTLDQMQQQQNAEAGTMQDKAFVRKALEGGMAEVQLGQLAQQKSQSQDVQQFGQKMVHDHTQLGDQLKPIAQQMGVAVPDKLPKKDQQLMDKLQGMSGAQFDAAYSKAMVKDHKDDLSEFRREADNTQNPQLKQVAQQGEQVITEHLHLAEQMEKAHSGK